MLNEATVPAAQAVRSPGTPLRIGRSPQSDVVLDDLLASRHHAELRFSSSGDAQIVDLGSANGTFVNGRRVVDAELFNLDFVSFAGSQFRFVDGHLQHYVEDEEVALAAVGVSVATGETTLVRDVSFALHRGSLTAVVGPSGAGKSSLLSALTGLRAPSAGAVYFGGRDLHRGYGELKHRIGFVPQDDIVHPELTVYQSVEFGASLRFAPDVSRRERRERVEEVLVEMELAHRRDVPVSRLSGGERKRVSVALELLTKPTLLLLDEPTSGLDPGLERNLMELFRRLADGGRVVIVVTHSVDSVHLCDRILFLAPGGRLAYFAPPQLAAAYFERADYQEIFRDLSEGEPESWRTRFDGAELSRLYVAEPLIGTSKQGVTHAAVVEPARGQRWSRQLVMLTERNVRVLAADRTSIATMFVAAPLLGLLALWRLPPGELGLPPESQIRLVSQASLSLFVVMLSMTLLGMSNGIREISKETRIIDRELAVGLSPSAYLVSKIALIGTITTIQAFVLVPIALARQGGPDDAVLLGWPLGEVMVAAALCGLAALAVGLFVSAIFQSTGGALACLPLLLAFQVLFGSSGVFPSAKEPFLLRELTYVSSTGWGFAAAGSTSDINELQRVNDVALKVRLIDPANPQPVIDALYDPTLGRDAFDHERGRWLTSAGALCAITLIGFAGAGIAVRRSGRER